MEPTVPGRPTLDDTEIRRRYGEAITGLRAQNRPLTQEAIAEWLGVSPRTVRDYRRRFDLR